MTSEDLLETWSTVVLLSRLCQTVVLPASRFSVLPPEFSVPTARLAVSAHPPLLWRSVAVSHMPVSTCDPDDVTGIDEVELQPVPHPNHTRS